MGVNWLKYHPVFVTATAAAATAQSLLAYLSSGPGPEHDGMPEKLELYQSARFNKSSSPCATLKPEPAVMTTTTTARSRRHSRSQSISPSVTWRDELLGGLLETQIPVETVATPPPLHPRTQRGGILRLDKETRRGKGIVNSALHRPTSKRGPKKSRAQSQEVVPSDTSPPVLGIKAASIRPKEESSSIDRSSPQWGWYVAITPPRDEFSASSSPPLPLATKPGGLLEPPTKPVS